jgi:acetyl esterase/lipase
MLRYYSCFEGPLGLPFMISLAYLRLKAIASVSRLVLPCPCTPQPEEIIQIPSRDSNRTIKAHVYRPANSTTPSPVLLNFHGSGWVLRWHGSDEVFCRRVAQKTNYVVLDIQYRLSPEYPFPAAHNDLKDVVKYVLSQSEDYDANRLSVSGFSAGANLAMGLTTSGAFPQNTFRALLAFYPLTDLFIDPGLKIQPDPSGPNVIPVGITRLFHECYFGDHDAKDPLISPTYADMTKLPGNVLIVTCAYDTLAPEAEQLADRIEKERGRASNLIRTRFEGVSHAWDKTVQAGSDGERKRDEVYAMAIEVLKR